MCKNILIEEKYLELEKYIKSLSDKKGVLIKVLHKAQNIFGYLPKEVQLFVAEKLNIPVSKVFAVVTFYSYFTTKARGEFVINVCTGTACFVRGAGNVLKELQRELGIKVGETTADGKFTIQVLRCVGACGLAPVVTVNNKVFGHVTKEQIKDIIAEFK